MLVAQRLQPEDGTPPRGAEQEQGGDQRGQQAAPADPDLLADVAPFLVEIRDARGRVVNRSPTLDGAALPPGDPGPDRLAVGAVRGERVAYAAFPVVRAGSAWAVVVGLPWSSTERILSDLGRLLGLLAAGGAVLATVGGHLLARAALRRVDAITAAAQRIGSTDLSARLAATGPPDELGRLVAAFNGMLDRLQAAYQRQAQFVADASHELRTPITAIRGHAAMLRRWARDDPRLLEASLAVIEREADYLSGLVSRLLALAREDAEAPSPREPVDLLALAREVLRSLEPLAEARQLVLDPAEPAVVQGDPVRLRELLLALLDNALRFTRPDGHVRVGVWTQGESAWLEVQDDGPGIDPEDLPHVFERFYRADRARTRSHGGAGLGLSLADAIARTHGGRIEASSQPGCGTCMRVCLPATGRPAG